MLLTNFYDTLNYISKWNIRRLYNAFILLVSYFRSKITKKNYHWGMPLSVSIEPTTSCNLRCPQCPSGLRSFERPTGMLSLSTFELAIYQLKEHLTYLTLYFQGEPYLNTHFFDFVKFAHSKKIYVSTSTNAHYLDIKQCEKTVSSGLDRLTISLDGLTDETYKTYRIGGNIDKVLQGTKNLIETKKKLKSKTPFVIWQFIVFAHNEHEIADVVQLSKSIGIDKLVLKTAQIYDFENGEKWMPKNKKYSRYMVQDEQLVIKNKLLNQCWRMWQGCVITWDGRVVPCCFDKDGSYNLGNIQSVSFKDIWKGKSYQSFRNLILKSRKNIEICKNCTEGTKVWV